MSIWMVLSFLNQLPNAGTLRVFTTECGSPGIRKSMSASSTIIDSWLLSWSAMDFSILRSTSSSTLNVSLSWEERTRELSFASTVLRVATSGTVLSWVCSTLRLFLSSDERVWVTSVATSRSVLSEELSYSFKKMNMDLLRTVRVSFILHVTKSPRSLTNWIWSWLGWLGTLCLSSNFSFWLSSNFRTPKSPFHSCFNEITGGGRVRLLQFSF